MISVIIPAYNVADYIEKCLHSVFTQTYDDLEVIVINDGSTDHTAELLKPFMSDQRLKYIDQKNAGVTSARNNGIAAATGEYITFVDSDDYLEPMMYEKLLSALTEADADVAACDYNLLYDDRTDHNYSGIKNETVMIDAPDYFFRYAACNRPNNYIWTRLYKADIIKKSGVRFENFRLGDDTLFNFKLLPFLNKIAYVEGGMYHYLQRPNSNIYTVAKKGNLAKVYADTFAELVSHYQKHNCDGFLKAMPIHAYTRLRSVIFYSRLAEMTEDEIAASIREGFRGREIREYLKDISTVDRYAMINGLAATEADEVKRLMLAAEYEE